MSPMDEDTNNLEVPGEQPASLATPPQAGSRKWPLVVGFLILIAIMLVGIYAWRHWQAQQQDQQDQQQVAQNVDRQQQQTLRQVTEQAVALEKAQAEQRKQAEGMDARLAENEAARQQLAAQLQGLGQRATQLEAAVSGLSRQQLSGADRMRLDDVEMLLQQADQRYSLLHDSGAALRAMRLAEKQLDALEDPGFSAVRQTLDNEIRTLAATRPETREVALATVQNLRASWPELPMKPLDVPAPVAVTGTWARIWHALSDLVRVRHESGEGDFDVADGRLARQLAAIDLAQAQAALLAFDQPTALAALNRTSVALNRDFDATSPAVQRVQAQLEQLRDELGSKAPEPELGAALKALRDQRRVRDLMPQSDSTSAPVDQAAPEPSDSPVPAEASSAANRGDAEHGA